MKIRWDENHGKILTKFITRLNEEAIRWFIVRGYEGLPNANSSKDVDIMVEVGKQKKAASLLKETFKEAGMKYCHSDQFGHIYCYIGVDVVNQISVHIDLVEGYISKGYEVFTFDELYQYVIEYNGLFVLNDFMNGIMLLVYKIFGYHKASLKLSYQVDIKKAQKLYPTEFKKILVLMLGKDFGLQVNDWIYEGDFDSLINNKLIFTKKIKKYTFRKRPLKTIMYSLEFLFQKVNRIIFKYKKYAKTFAVMAPDGAGKTTFIDSLVDKLNYYYVNNAEDNRFHVYHFRPSILPNLGAVAEKAGVMKQDTDFTDPHRSKPANPISSIVRISYYTLDYILGWMKCVRNDVHYDRYSVFDRYSYDFIVDPKRTKLRLTKNIRKFFVSLTPQPKIVFYLDANPNVIFARKQELTLDEITRQVDEYRRLIKTNKQRFILINAEQRPSKMVDESIIIILNKFMEKL